MQTITISETPGSNLLRVTQGGRIVTWPKLADALDEYEALDIVCALLTGETMPVVDTSSSASRQHYIDTGRYLREGEALD